LTFYDYNEQPEEKIDKMGSLIENIRRRFRRHWKAGKYLSR
jgi:hypothetical protein